MQSLSSAPARQRSVGLRKKSQYEERSCFIAIINVFVTGWWIKRFGVKAALFQQTGWAAARNLTQIYAQTLGGRLGVTIIQSTQVFNVMGSGGGYALAANAFIAVLAEPEERTALFGMLGGMQMLGSAAGFVRKSKIPNE